jgi:tetratricopeptide (TPR) repeat protein
MAVYKKKDKTAKQLRKDRAAIESSTTKDVFEGLDSSANKAEEWLLKNQKILLIVLGVLVAGALAYMAYMRFVQEPAEEKAANELAYPKAYFDQAQKNSVASDSLYTMALDGADGKYGLLEVAEKFSSTKAGNLAKYYAGIAYLKKKDYKNAISYLSDFSSDDMMLGSVAKGAIGDAFANLGQLDDAYTYYKQATEAKPNNYTTPFFLDKAAATALSLGKNKDAEEFYNRIKIDFSKSEQAKDIDGKINRAKYAAK